MTKLDTTDIFEVLDAIKKRAGLFLLKSHIDYLYNFLNGYKLLANSTEIEIKNLDKFEQFPAFLKTKLNEEFDNTMVGLAIYIVHMVTRWAFKSFLST